MQHIVGPYHRPRTSISPGNIKVRERGTPTITYTITVANLTFSITPSPEITPAYTACTLSKKTNTQNINHAESRTSLTPSLFV